MKRFIVAMIIFTTIPAFADDINMTSQNNFSGYYNKSNIRTTYPRLNVTTSTTNQSEVMKPKSVLDMGDYTPSNDGKTPMTYSQFPQHYDSSNMIYTQGNMQNMYMGF
jgi:hypothetical protein